MKQNFRRLLLCLSLAGAPFLRTEALDWVPVGDNVDANGFARTGATYESKDVIEESSLRIYNTQLTTSSLLGADNTINIFGTLYTGAPATPTAPPTGSTGIPCSLKVNSDVQLTAIDADMTINVLEDVVIEPYFQAPVGGFPEADCAHLYFNAGVGRKINVNLDHDLTFQGKTTGSGFRDMLVTFAGVGQVVFNMADGTTINFDGQADTSAPLTLDENGLLVPCVDRLFPSASAAGTKVFVLMDQTYDQAVNQLQNKVLFKRKNFSSANDDQRVLIAVGENSVFTYLSTNPTGLGSEAFLDGYGAVAFDPSNAGRGRMVLFIKGAYKFDSAEFIGESETPNPTFGQLLEKYQFNDGAVIVGGHFVNSFDATQISGCGLPGESETVTPGYDFSKPAGIQAIMRIIDDGFFANRPTNPYVAPAADRRGLLVVNDVASHGKLASDPYWDLYTSAASGFVGTDFSYSNPANSLNNVRKGFILAVNGLIDMYHNTFVDHVSGFGNQCDPLAQCDFADPNFFGDPNWIKPRNPSAFIVDGLDTGLFINGNPYNSNNPSEFIAANPYLQSHISTGKVQARGYSRLYLKSAASAKWGYMRKFWTSGPDPLGDKTLDYTTIFALGTGAYNGRQIDPVGNDDVIQTGEGNHVLDVEGPLDFVSLPTDTIPGRFYDFSALASNQGTLNASPLLRDFSGREALGGDHTAGGTLISRPLKIDGTQYDRYNSATLFFNNFAAFSSAILRHTDVAKYVDGVPALSEPGITGGERLWFARKVWGASHDNTIADPNRFRFPEIQLFNSTLELQESLNASGVRFVVKDTPNFYSDGADNFSVVKFFDHGDQLDTKLTGFGRILLCGSALNNMCDGASNIIGESCFVNVFRSSGPSPVPFEEQVFTDIGTDPTNVLLSLQDGDQFSTDIAAAIVANPALREKQRAHHLFMFAQPPHEKDGAICNMEIGWANNTSMTYSTIDSDPQGSTPSFSPFTGPAGDKGFFPGSFPYPASLTSAGAVAFAGEPLVTDANFFTTSPFPLDALKSNPAITSIDGSIICFGSFDKAGNSIKIPLKTDNDAGAVYVKHGGKLTTTVTAPADRSVIPNQSVFSTMVGQRLWNDYDFAGINRVIELTGDLDLPHDQVTFDSNMGVQPYNITSDMFGARRADTGGYARLSFENGSRDPLRADRSGAEEVTIGWFYRDTPDFTLFPNSPDVSGLGTGGNITPVKEKVGKLKTLAMAKSKWMSRSTESVDTPFPRPADLLYVGPGDEVTQMKVAGATMSDPFILDVSGDSVRPVSARVREFVSLKSTRDQLADHFIGEGAHAVLFLEYNGRIGLGDRHWNDLSVGAWNLLGKDYVTICPLGDGVVDLNDNLLVTDRLAIMPSTTFGSSADASSNRLTFFSSVPREIRIPAGGELDLSGFGRNEGRQEIAFSGRTRLVIEEGATLRLPDQPNGGLVLYFNDESELIFEGAQDPSTFLPFVESGPTTAPSANSRIKIVGQGQIWLNKNGRIRVNNNVFVGVETDALSPITDLTISIQREGRMDVGDEFVSGGAFQVGNPEPRFHGENFDTINFTLQLNGPTSTFHVDRQGFFGLGAGVFNKNGKPNGSATTVGNPVLVGGVVSVDINGNPIFTPDLVPADGGWLVQPLFNVNNVTVTVPNGIFDHSNIFDGSNSNASLMAVGPANQFVWQQADQNTASLRGGGNVMLVPAGASYQANIWDYAGKVSTGESYGIFASSGLLLDRGVPGDIPAAAFGGVGNAGKSFTFATPADFFGLLNCVPFDLQGALPGQVKRVDIGTTAFVSGIVYELFNSTNDTKYNALPGSLVVRQSSPASIGGGTIADAIERGYLNAIGIAVPNSFTSNP